MANFNQLLEKITLPLAIVLSISLLIGAYFFIKRFDQPNVTPSDEQKITVDVAGAVNQPGVYTLADEQIVEDAIALAGGLADTADIVLLAKIINRAALVQDHSKIYIPIKGDTAASIAAESVSSTSASTGSSSIININTATTAELDRLPGIGPIIAGRIIEYRQKHGAFKRKEDIIKVDGIGDALYAKIKNRITL